MNDNASLYRIARRLALAAAVLALPLTVGAQQVFPTPDAAVAAFVDGVSRNDDEQVARVLGTTWKRYVPTEAVSGEDVTQFLEAWSRGHRVLPAGDSKAYLEVGTHGWTLPIPLIKTAGGWRFDTEHTADELRTRRIGRNETNVIQVLLAIGDAQRDFAQNDRDRNGVQQYAQKLLSTPGKHDGLYWPALADEPESPLGPIAATVKPGDAYHGYRYRILTAQGAAAPGGARSYIVNGQMTGGFAVVAWPATWGDTGVMTFIMAADGRVYQSNLGPTTDARARQMKAFDPGTGWTAVDAP
ncbi:MAG: DUF2950 domain-containing protein [Proteobacteria bacterium]|nr:DUF2950 domain-containing protein [Pseudomonadota bacterium]